MHVHVHVRILTVWDWVLQGISGLSDYPISFHYCSINCMYNMEYFVYHLRPYGILSGLQDLNTNHPRDPRSVMNVKEKKDKILETKAPQTITIQKSKVVRIDERATLQRTGVQSNETAVDVDVQRT